MKKILAAGILSTVSMWAGALTIRTASPAGNPQAESMHAVLVARVTACREPGKSSVEASYLQLDNGATRRTSLNVVPLSEAGSFAVVGNVPSGSVISIAVTNPDYRNYRPQVLLRYGPQGLDWASMHQFYGTPPTDSEVNTFLVASK